METNLRKLFDDARQQIDTYKHPDISEFKDEMSKVLEAAGLGSLKHEYIENITEYKDWIEIDTSWSARGCAQTSTYKLPSAIIDAEDPIREAKLYGVNKRLSDAQAEHRRYQSYVESYAAQIAKLQAELATI